MSWYKKIFASLEKDIARLLIVVYNNAGQSDYSSLFSKISTQIIDQSILDVAVQKAISLALKKIKISQLTPKMQEAITALLSSFKGEPEIQKENQEISLIPEEKLQETSEEEILPEEIKNVEQKQI